MTHGQASDSAELTTQLLQHGQFHYYGRLMQCLTDDGWKAQLEQLAALMRRSHRRESHSLSADLLAIKALIFGYVDHAAHVQQLSWRIVDSRAFAVCVLRQQPPPPGPLLIRVAGELRQVPLEQDAAAAFLTDFYRRVDGAHASPPANHWSSRSPRDAEESASWKRYLAKLCETSGNELPLPHPRAPELASSPNVGPARPLAPIPTAGAQSDAAATPMSSAGSSGQTAWMEPTRPAQPLAAVRAVGSLTRGGELQVHWNHQQVSINLPAKRFATAVALLEAIREEGFEAGYRNRDEIARQLAAAGNRRKPGTPGTPASDASQIPKYIMFLRKNLRSKFGPEGGHLIETGPLGYRFRCSPETLELSLRPTS